LRLLTVSPSAPGRLRARAYCWPAPTAAGEANTPASREEPLGTDASAIVVEASTVFVGLPMELVARICIGSRAPAGRPRTSV
jgi:hypothetical protein